MRYQTELQNLSQPMPGNVWLWNYNHLIF